ncbi:oligopeptide transporter, OPT family [Alphaproteobacteria bacterium]|nr:oligopeptide transporter, OPT family [Alphaproteobacteria bacterium]
MNNSMEPLLMDPLSKKKNKIVIDPYISPSKDLPEITFKAFVLSIVLTIIMSAANAYLGLKVGITVAATIPAAVISMAILKMFRHSNILENNIVQTTVSAGEGLAAAAVFTLPALIMMKFWTHFPFWSVTALLVLGGIMGVLFSIPLRRVFLIEGDLKFPEGIAAAEVLKAGDGASKAGLKDLVVGSVLAASLKFGQSGLSIFQESIDCWKRFGSSVFGFSTGISGILVGAGYIVGIQVAVSIILGSIVAWGICVPIYASIGGYSLDLEPYALVMQVWKDKLRIIGVGCMVTGGIWTTLTLLGSMKSAIVSSFEVIKKTKLNKKLGILALRTERDIPINYVGIGLLLSAVFLSVLLHTLFSKTGLVQFGGLYWVTIAVMTISCLVLGFLAAVISAYIAGMIGSSNSPLSGIAIMVILSISLILSALVSSVGSSVSMLAMAAITVLLGALIAGTAVISLDNLQDLKAGQVVGATPWKQQVMLIVGLIISACFMAPILNVLLEAYGIGDVFPREGMDVSQVLTAPKAALMAGLAQSVFDLSLGWGLMFVGVGIGIIFIFVDEIAKRTSTWRIPILAVAVGIYMPLEITVPILIGGLISYFSEKKINRSKKNLGEEFKEKAQQASQRGLLTASGIVAGEALVGIFVAVLIVFFPSVKESISGLIFSESLKLILGAGLFSFLCFYLYRVASSIQGGE